MSGDYARREKKERADILKIVKRMVKESDADTEQVIVTGAIDGNELAKIIKGRNKTAYRG